MRIAALLLAVFARIVGGQQPAAVSPVLRSVDVFWLLVKSPRYRAAIDKQAVPSLLKLLRLRQANNHDPAYEILKELSGKTFGERDYKSWESWAAAR